MVRTLDSVMEFDVPTDEDEAPLEEPPDPFDVLPEEQDPDFLFLLFGTETFEQWINDHRVFKKLGDIYRKQFMNHVIAAEFYAMASEIIAGNCSVGEKKVEAWGPNNDNPFSVHRSPRSASVSK